jgi:hypothetical protein
VVVTRAVHGPGPMWLRSTRWAAPASGLEGHSSTSSVWWCSDEACRSCHELRVSDDEAISTVVVRPKIAKSQDEQHSAPRTREASSSEPAGREMQSTGVAVLSPSGLARASSVRIGRETRARRVSFAQPNGRLLRRRAASRAATSTAWNALRQRRRGRAAARSCWTRAPRILGGCCAGVERVQVSARGPPAV